MKNNLNKPLLAVDTSTPAASVALQVNNNIFSRFHQEKAKHTEVILPMIDELLDEQNLTIADLGGLILSAGPGAFTGLRVGASVVAGLAIAYDTPIGCISSLALLAGGAPPGKILSLLDARMQQSYAGFYHYSGQSMVALDDDCLCSGEQIPSQWLEQANYIVGAGACYLAAEYADKANQDMVPEAKNTFSLLDLVKWQRADVAIDLFYLRNEVAHK